MGKFIQIPLNFSFFYPRLIVPVLPEYVHGTVDMARDSIPQKIRCSVGKYRFSLKVRDFSRIGFTRPPGNA